MGLQGRSERFGEEKSLLLLPGFELQTVQRVASGMGYMVLIWGMMGWKLVGQKSCAEGRARSCFRVLCRRWPGEDTSL